MSDYFGKGNLFEFGHILVEYCRCTQRLSLGFNTDSSFVETISCQIPHPSQLLTVLGEYRSPTPLEAVDEQISRSVRSVHAHFLVSSQLSSDEEDFLFSTIISSIRFREGNNLVINLAFAK